MIFEDYYKILGFDTNKVSQTELRNAYHEKAKKYHPDIANTKENSSYDEIFKDINEAYRILSNPRLKRKYDFSWNRYVGKKKQNEEPKQKKSIKEILISIFFGNVTKREKKQEQAPKYGENINTQVNVSISEAYFGATKIIKLKDIKGKETNFKVNIPAGVQNHDKIRIIGQGKKGNNGGKNGDLIIDLNIVNSANLQLEGIDLKTILPLKIWEAALGTTKKINILQEEINIIIPKETNSGSTLTIPGKGYKNGRGLRGNLKILTKIETPKNPTEEGKQTLEKLKKLNY